MWCGVVVGAAIEARRLLSVEREHDAMSVHNFTIALKPILAFTITHHGLGREQRTHPASFLQVLSINHLCNPNTGPHVDDEIPPPPTSGSTRHVKHEARPERTATRTPSDTCRKTFEGLLVGKLAASTPIHVHCTTRATPTGDKRAIERMNVCNETEKTLVM